MWLITVLLGCHPTPERAPPETTASEQTEDTSVFTTQTDTDTDEPTEEPVWPAIVINELQASNHNTIHNELEDSADWLELFNPAWWASSRSGSWTTHDEELAYVYAWLEERADLFDSLHP